MLPIHSRSYSYLPSLGGHLPMQLPGIGSPVAARSGTAAGRDVDVDIRNSGAVGRAGVGANAVRI